MGKNSSKEHVNKVMSESVAETTNVATVAQAISKLGVAIQTPFIDADAFIADPYALLGQVIMVRKKDGKCPESLVDPGYPVELTPFPVPHKVNENSKLKKPELRNSIMVDQNLAASVSFLNYLSAELNAVSTFSIMVFDQAAGVIDMNDVTWKNGLEEWKKTNLDLINDEQVCYLFAITGFIQKNIVRKKYVKYDGKAKGGAFGVNINGQLSTSTEEYSLDVKFGLTPVVIKRPAPVERVTRRPSLTRREVKVEKLIASKPSKNEVQLFNSIMNSKMFDSFKREMKKKKKKNN